MLKIILHGCLGRMGKVIQALTERDESCEIVAGVDIASTGGGLAFPTYTEISCCDMPADAVLDFSNLSALRGLLQYGERTKTPLVICTTGMSQEDKNEVKKASAHVAVFQSANMSLGVNLIANMLDRAARLLYNARFDVEIVEKHHNQKLDAPSGTALLLAESVNRALDNRMELVYDRSARREKRGRNEIGMHTVRGGSIVGEHRVIFAGQDETLEFTHIAESREVFAVGALKAAEFIKGRPPGMYDMQDLINAIL